MGEISYCANGRLYGGVKNMKIFGKNRSAIVLVHVLLVVRVNIFFYIGRFSLFLYLCKLYEKLLIIFPCYNLAESIVLKGLTTKQRIKVREIKTVPTRLNYDPTGWVLAGLA